MVWLYPVALFFLLLASYAHNKTSQSIGAQPMPGTAIHSMYSWFGGGLSTIGILLLLGLFYIHLVGASSFIVRWSVPFWFGIRQPATRRHLCHFRVPRRCSVGCVRSGTWKLIT
jgi:hypothetical protein